MIRTTPGCAGLCVKWCIYSWSYWLSTSSLTAVIFCSACTCLVSITVLSVDAIFENKRLTR